MSLCIKVRYWYCEHVRKNYAVCNNCEFCIFAESTSYTLHTYFTFRECKEQTCMRCLTINYWVGDSSKIRSLITYLHLFMHEKSKWWLLFSVLPWCLNVKCYKRLQVLSSSSPNLAYMSGERVILYTFVLPLSLAFKLSEMHPRHVSGLRFL